MNTKKTLEDCTPNELNQIEVFKTNRTLAILHIENNTLDGAIHFVQTMKKNLKLLRSNEIDHLVHNHWTHELNR